METQMISTNIANGTVHYSNRSENISDVKWAKHPQFNGVSLKHLIKGRDTDGLFSSHLVKIDPGCCLETHFHENELELHEVIEGDGSCQLIDNIFNYYFGKMAVIPKGKSHRVKAGKSGLTILAKFFPAMV